MNKKKIMLTICAMILVIAITAAGTLAYMTATTEDQLVKNTFLAVGGGNLIDPENKPEKPTVKDEDGNDVEIMNGFFLVENKYNYNEETLEYEIDANSYVTGNKYTHAAPGMTIGKNPKLTVNIAKDAAAYVFVEVIDETDGNITCTMGSDWTLLSGVSKHTGGAVYVYNAGGFITGTDAVELNAIPVLKDNQVMVTTEDLVDQDTETEGSQLGELSFYAYVCQAQGFEDAADAFTECFN